jgi:hypothetical protein
MYYIVYDYYWYENTVTGYVIYSIEENEFDIHINFMYEYMYEKVT